MGTSTVSGPFRSENGFQQLDANGVWVPVAGGGGGGVTSIVAGSGISVSSPTGAVTISATGGGGGETATLMQWGDVIGLPVPTAIGQVYEVNVAYSYNASGTPGITIVLPTIDNGFSSFALITAYVVDPYTSPNFQALFNASTSEIGLNPSGQIAYANFRIVYVGPVTAGPQTANVFQTFVNVMYATP